jgi:hypothetical protein
MEFGAIDDAIVDKLRDDENVRVRLQVRAESAQSLKCPKDPQMPKVP